ncbi:trichohyalin-like [Cydia strobilella]|uniref:trichohyalin-like n=1 Tax=Cydia strobilella TaxID=1100964 RepID=UPI00300430F2
MHNGCLLLLAFVAVFQPIASYTERGLVNGRQERCDYRSSVRDPELNFHGSYRFNKPAVEDRCLNQRDDIRKLRRNEVKEETLRIASSSDRRLADTVERERFTLTRLSSDRIGNDAVLHREIHKTLPVSSHRDERKQETRRERLSTAQESHQARFSGRRENSRLSVDENRSQRIDNKRFNERASVASRRDIRENRINADTKRVREHREVRSHTNRARDNGASSLIDHRIAKEAVQKMDTRRSVSRIQQGRNADREILNRRSSREIRSSSTSGDKVNRASANEGSRFVVEQRQRESQIRLTVERRNIRDSASRRVLANRISENRRNTQRAQSADTRRETRDTENEARLARAVQSVDDRVTRKDLSGSRTFKREITAENRRNARSMAASLERSAYRMESRREFLKRVLENRNDNRNIETAPRQNINNIRAAETRKAIRNAERDFRVFKSNAKRTVETCVYDRKPSSEHRMARIMTRERSQENRRFTRNVPSQTIRTERVDEDRQEALNVGIRAFRTERSDDSGRDARNFEVRAFRNERAVRSQRDSRSVGTRSSRTERSEFRTERTDESRRDARTVKVPAIRRERTEERRRDARSIGVRSFRTERFEQSRRDSRNVISQLFSDERTDEVRRHAINFELRAFRTECTDGRRRDARILEARSFRSERTDESRRDARELGIRAFRSEQRNSRSADIRADARSNRVLVFRPERTDKGRRDNRVIESATYRRDTQGIERQIRSLDRTTDYRRDSQNNNRDARIQERALESRRMVRNIVSRAKDERANNRRATRSLERDIRSMGRQRSMESRLNRDRRSEEKRRGSDRAIERLDKRDSLESRRIFTFQRESRRDTQRTLDRDNLARGHMEAESRNSFDIEFARKRELQGMFRNPTQTENETTMMNWQYIFYTLQGLYICGLLIQLNKGRVEKKTRVSWWPAPQHLIKVD